MRVKNHLFVTIERMLRVRESAFVPRVWNRLLNACVGCLEMRGRGYLEVKDKRVLLLDKKSNALNDKGCEMIQIVTLTIGEVSL